MIYPIVKYGDPVLEVPAETVREFDTPELHKLLQDMCQTSKPLYLSFQEATTVARKLVGVA